MKKSLYSIFALIAMLVAFTSCEKDEVQNTATVDAAGEWHVTFAALDENGEVYDDDWFGDGVYNIATSNTAANVPNKMYIIDNVNSFVPYQVEVDLDLNNLTFKTTDAKNLYGPGNYEDIFEEDTPFGDKITITDGKIVKNGYTKPNGIKVDYIEFYISFSDDVVPEMMGINTKYKVSGFRYTGFVEDE